MQDPGVRRVSLHHVHESPSTRGTGSRPVCKVPNGSQKYFEGEILMQMPLSISGWVEIPVIGPELRVVISGDPLPKLESKISHGRPSYSASVATLCGPFFEQNA